MTDYICLPRSALEFVSDGNTWQLYGYLLKIADEDGIATISLRNLSKETKLSLRSVRTALRHLEEKQYVTQQPTQQATQINLCGIADKGRAATQQKTQRPTRQATQISAVPQDGYDRFLEYFNRKVEHTPIKSIRTLSDARKKALRSIFKEFGGKEVVEEALDKVVRSQWCCGNNDKGWLASFDWIFKKANFIKILEGNYDNRTRQSQITDQYPPRRGADVGDHTEADYGGPF